MPRCRNCNKFIMFGNKSAFCKDCEAIIMESREEEKRAEQKKEELKSGTIDGFVFETLPDGTLRIVEYDRLIPSFMGLTVPAQLDGRRVSTIGTDLMRNNSRVKCAIEVSEGITVIEDGAFGNPDIIEILLPESISQVTGNPFYNAFGGMIKEVVVHVSANHPYLTIYDGVMYGKRDKRVIYYFPNKRTEYIVPNGIVTVGKHAIFSNQLTSVILPDSVTRIEESGIHGALINYLRLPNQLRYIGKWAFSPRTKNKTYIIPRTVETIEPAAFSGVNLELETEDCPFSIQNGILIESATKKALCRAKADIRELTIPNSVEIIAKGAFQYSDITKVKLPDSIKVIEDEAFIGADRLEKADLPTGLVKIGNKAFDGCKKLRLKVPSSVIEIGKEAFGGFETVELLIVEAGSYAEEYANRNRYKYSTSSSDLDPMAWLNEDQTDETMLQNGQQASEEGNYSNERKEDYKDRGITLQKGDLVFLGAYPFYENDDTRQLIDWIIVDVENDTFLLMTKYLIDAVQYNTYENPRTDIPNILDSKGRYRYVWHNSSLRKWLNESFFMMAFNEKDRQALLTKDISFPEEIYEEKTEYGPMKLVAEPLMNSQDKVFIPSIEEAEIPSKLCIDPEWEYCTPYAYGKAKDQKCNSCRRFWNLTQPFSSDYNRARISGSGFLGDYISGYPAIEFAYLRPMVLVKKDYIYETINSYSEEIFRYYQNRLNGHREKNTQEKARVEKMRQEYREQKAAEEAEKKKKKEEEQKKAEEVAQARNKGPQNEDYDQFNEKQGLGFYDGKYYTEESWNEEHMNPWGTEDVGDGYINSDGVFTEY